MGDHVLSRHIQIQPGQQLPRCLAGTGGLRDLPMVLDGDFLGAADGNGLRAVHSLGSVGIVFAQG